MRNSIFTYFLLLNLVVANSQPPLNQWYNLGGSQSVINSIVPTDSCYYFTGIVHDGIAPISWNLVFGKLDFNGNIISQTNYSSDTIGLNGINCIGSNLISTVDGNFATLTDYGNIFLFLKISPLGDTVGCKLIDHYFSSQNFNSIRPSAVLQNPLDSSFVCLLKIQNSDTYESKIGLVILDNSLNVIGYQNYQILQPNYAYTNPRSIIILEDGYLISCDIVKPGVTFADNRLRTRFIKTDFSGNELWRWTDWDCEADAFPFGLTETPDGGFLYGGISGAYDLEANGQQYVASITKLDASLNKEWKITMGDSISDGWINFTDIKCVEENRYVSSGYWYSGDSSVIGTLINFNLSGEILWDSYFSYVPASDLYNYPWHELYDVDITPDGGFIMVGKAEDWVALSNNNPGSFGWVVKTDSVGCLVPGCQDFFGVDENLLPQIKLSLYPNPTNSILNIYYNDPQFSGNATAQVFDLSGNKIHSWRLHSNDMTYIYDISTFAAGTYILKIVESGVEKSQVKFVKM